MVERPLSMREVPGSITGSSTLPFCIKFGIKAMSRGFLGQTTDKKLPRNRDQVCLCIELK